MRVVAPVPWVPFAGRCSVSTPAPARAHATARSRACRVTHPRFFAVPRAEVLNPLLHGAERARRCVARLQQEQRFDLIDAHFVYPEGAAAVLLGRWLGKPLVVTVRGTDINDFPEYRGRRAHGSAGSRDARRRCITVSAVRCGSCAAALGVLAERVDVLRNGVDLELFSAGRSRAPRARARVSSGPTADRQRRTLVSPQGASVLIEALARSCPRAHLADRRATVRCERSCESIAARPRSR